jgi:hypothetical protein
LFVDFSSLHPHPSGTRSIFHFLLIASITAHGNPRKRNTFLFCCSRCFFLFGGVSFERCCCFIYASTSMFVEERMCQLLAQPLSPLHLFTPLFLSRPQHSQIKLSHLPFSVRFFPLRVVFWALVIFLLVLLSAAQNVCFPHANSCSWLMVRLSPPLPLSRVCYADSPLSLSHYVLVSSLFLVVLLVRTVPPSFQFMVSVLSVGGSARESSPSSHQR